MTKILHHSNNFLITWKSYQAWQEFFLFYGNYWFKLDWDKHSFYIRVCGIEISFLYD